jgi:transposase InsO family protein
MAKKRYRPEEIIGKLRDELLNREVFHPLKEASLLIEQWRRHYNGVRPHNALRYRPPVPETVAYPGAGLLSTMSFLENPGGLLH